MLSKVLFVLVAIATQAALSCSGNDSSEQAVIARILSVSAAKAPEDTRLLGRDREAQFTNLVSILCRNWKTAGNPQDRVKLLRFAATLPDPKQNVRRPNYRLSDAQVGTMLVDGLDDADDDVRVTAAALLEKECDSKLIHTLGSSILKSVAKRQNTDAILLLGRTGLPEAARLLGDDKRYKSASTRAVQLALAKLGNGDLQTQFVLEFRSATDPRDKMKLARDLAYIGSYETCRCLAAELRTPEKVQAGAAYSLRVFIIEALSKAYPDEMVLWRPSPSSEPKDDSYYEDIEKWAEATFKLVWTQPRPPFFYTMPTPIKQGTLVK